MFGFNGGGFNKVRIWMNDAHQIVRFASHWIIPISVCNSRLSPIFSLRNGEYSSDSLSLNAHLSHSGQYSINRPTVILSSSQVNSMLRTGALSEWRLVFISHAVLLIVCNVIFCVLTTAKPALWTEPDVPMSNRRNQSFLSVKSVDPKV